MERDQAGDFGDRVALRAVPLRQPSVLPISGSHGGPEAKTVSFDGQEASATFRFLAEWR